MSSVFNCLILLCVVSLVTAQQANYSTTIRPPPHHRHMHHGNHKHNRTHITNEDTNPILHLLPLDTSGGMRTTTKPSAASSIRSQKLFLINANQQPTSSSASATNDLYQPNFSPRWPSTLHSHYPIHNTGHHRPRTTTMDLGYDWRSRGTRTFYADAPYTTITPPTTSYRPEHRFSGKHGYVVYIPILDFTPLVIIIIIIIGQSYIYSFKLLINSAKYVFGFFCSHAKWNCKAAAIITTTILRTGQLFVLISIIIMLCARIYI